MGHEEDTRPPAGGVKELPTTRQPGGRRGCPPTRLAEGDVDPEPLARLGYLALSTCEGVLVQPGERTAHGARRRLETSDGKESSMRWMVLGGHCFNISSQCCSMASQARTQPSRLARIPASK